MPTYTYRCEPCEQDYDSIRSVDHRRDPLPCPSCGGPTLLTLGRVNFARSSVQSDAHFSHVTGQVVRNAQDMADQLHRMNEEQGTHYVLADPTDPSAFGVTEEGLDETARAKTSTGERTPTLWL